MKFLFFFFLFFFFFSTISSQEVTKSCENDVCLNPDVEKQENTRKTEQKFEKKPPAASLDHCEDRYERCQEFASQNSCEDNPGWMIVNCPVSCNACSIRDPRIRCTRDFLNTTESLSYQPGQMKQMFEDIPLKYGEKYGVRVLSSDPYVVYFENFLTDEESDAFISLNNAWERSTDTGSKNSLGETSRILSSGRTSSNAWCRGDCERSPQVQEVMKKIQEVIQVPFENSEQFQILRYELGQYYKTHHDMNP